MRKHFGRTVLGLLALVLLGVSSSAADQASGPASRPAASRPALPQLDPTVPAIKVDGASLRGAVFTKRHEDFVKIAKAGNVDLLFLGDSITDFWAGAGKNVWAQHYQPLKAANFGIAGDQTQHVLWRIQNGELEGIAPKVVVVMLGTNNLETCNSDAAIAAGVEAIVKTVRDKLPQSKILLLGIFPRGEKPNANRDRIKNINAIIAKLEDGKNVKYLDIGDKFLQPDQTISKEVMADSLHPTAKGYQIWAEAMQETLDAMMK